MKLFYLILPAALLILACKKGKPKIKACGVEDPAKNIAWLKHAIDSLDAAKKQGEFTLLSYDGQDYLGFRLVYQSCMYCQLFTCSGTQLAYPEDSALVRILSSDSRVKRMPLVKVGSF